MNDLSGLASSPELLLPGVCCCFVSRVPPLESNNHLGHSTTTWYDTQVQLVRLWLFCHGLFERQQKYFAQQFAVDGRGQFALLQFPGCNFFVQLE